MVFMEKKIRGTAVTVIHALVTSPAIAMYSMWALLEDYTVAVCNNYTPKRTT